MFGVVFFGTPEFAVPSLEALLQISDVRAAVVQPDRPRGRGRAVEPPPVKRRALDAGLRVLQPERLKPPELAAELRGFAAEVFVVAAYGKILPPGLLEIPSRGCVNVHGSLLPRHRGAAPIQWALRSGDRVTGVTLMKMDEGMDTGPILSKRETPIDPDETAGDLSARLSRLGAELLQGDLPRWVRGEITPVDQVSEDATAAPRLRKEEGAIDWSLGVRVLHDHVRAMHPWPGAFTTVSGKHLKVHRASVGSAGAATADPGTVVSVGPEGLGVACGGGILLVLEAQVEGRRRMPAAELARGLRVTPGTRLE